MKLVCQVCFLTLCGAGQTLAQTNTGQLARQFGWHTHLEGAKTAARQSGKPIFLVFRCDP